MNKLPQGWQELPFSECVNKISIKYKIKQKYYLKNGKYPIIDQGQNFIGGYSNDEIAINIKKPVIVFGDHTRCFKYIDFDFIAGADGIKILEPKNFFNEKLFYYFCLILDFPNKGYSRHYQYLTKTIMRIPPIEVQKEIASRLDFSFDKIDRALKLLNQNKEYIKKYRLSLLKYAFDGKLTPSSKNWEIKTLNDVCIPSSSNIAFKEVKDKKGDYPIYGASGIVAYADFYSKEKECIGIVKDGSVGKIFLLPAKSSVISTLNYLENTDNLDIKYLYYFLQRINFVKYIKGSVIPHIYFRDYKKEKIPVPPLEVQKEIVSILDNEFEVMEKVEKLNNENIENLLLLKKSLLKEAFSGNLLMSKWVKFTP